MTDKLISNSVVFSAAPIIRINQISQESDSRLFLFAYYTPKEYPRSEENHLRFLYAITNIYGLFWDSGAFLRTNLFAPHKEGMLSGLFSVLSYTDSRRNSQRISDFLGVIAGFRTMYCHNFTTESYVNQEHLKRAKLWASNIIVGFSNFNNISDSEWRILLVSIVSELESILDVIESCLKLLLKVESSKKEVIINYWLKSVCTWYCKSDWMMNYAQSIYDYKRHESAQYKELNATTRAMTQKWLCEKYGSVDKFIMQCNTDITKLVFNSKCPMPALPNDCAEEILKGLLDD